MAAVPRRARSDPLSSRSRPLSKTLLVNSSTNSGTPSVRSTIWATTSSGNALPPAICSTRAVRSRRSRRLSASIVTCGWPVQGGWNSGRNVTISSTGRLRTRSTVRSSSSREVGSIQCASSKTMTTGCWRARPSSCRISASSVRSFLRCGLRFGSGWRSEAGNDSRSARNATSSSGGAARASKASSFSSLAAGGSSRANPAARPSWSINGNSALSW